MSTKTISGIYSTTFYFHSPYTALDVARAGYVDRPGGTAIESHPATQAYTVINDGRVSGNVYLGDGGSVTNGSASNTSADIIGFNEGVFIRNAIGKVVNYGEIGAAESTGTEGVYLNEGGKVTNGASSVTDARISGYDEGVFIRNAVGTIANFATIASAGTAAISPAAYLADGGLITNGTGSDTSALLEAAGEEGADIRGAVGTISNFGTIESGPATGVGVAAYLGNGGLLTNGSASDTSATIKSDASIGAWVRTTAGTVTNFGTIEAAMGSGPDSAGAYAADGGRITNGTTIDTKALIAGYIGVEVRAAAGTVVNFGVIDGAGDAGVYVESGGAVTNGGAANSNAMIEGALGVALGAGGTVTNFGTIEGKAGDSVEFQASSAVLQAEAGSVFIGKVNVAGGAVRVVSGVADFTGGLLTKGTVSGSGTLALSGGASTFETGASLAVAKVAESGAGTGVAVKTSDLLYSGVWVQTGGKISVAKSDEVDFTGTGDTFAGTLAGAGTVTFGGGASTLNPGALLSVAKLDLLHSGARLVLATDIDYGGAFSQGAGTTLALSANTLTLTGTASLAGAVTGPGGGLDFSGGAETIGTGAALSMSDWTIGGGAAVSLSVTMVYDEAFAENAATITIAAGDTLNLQAAANFTGATVNGGTLITHAATSGGGLALGGGAVWENDGTLTEGATTTLGDGVSGAAKIENEATGVWDFTGDVGVALAGSGGSIVNYGVLKKTAGSGTSLIAASVTNASGAEIFVSSGTLELGGAVSGGGKAVIAGGALKLDGAFSQNVDFTGASGELELADSHAYAGTVSGFSLSAGTTLDLDDIAYAAGTTKASYAGTASGGVLTITSGSDIARVRLTGDYLTSTWTLSDDGRGGTLVADPAGAAGKAPITATHSFIQATAAVGARTGAIDGWVELERGERLPSLVNPA